MKLEIPSDQIAALVMRQLNSLFTFDVSKEQRLIQEGVGVALDKCEHCFSHSINKYYRDQNRVYFNPFHSGQYSIFLYFLSAAIYGAHGNIAMLPDRIYYLNKCLNSLDLLYEVKMPSIFFLDHPVGSVIGRASYKDYFSFSQNCTVGNNKGKYPSFGKNVKMMSGAKVIGDCRIGNDVIISANTYIKDVDIPSYSIVFGSSPNLTIKSKPHSYFSNSASTD